MIGGNVERDGVIFVCFAHGGGGHDDDFVGVEGAGLVGLGAAYHDAVFAFFDHVQVEIRVGLLVGGQRAVALGVGHGAVAHQVLLLHAGEKMEKAPVVFGAPLLIDGVGDDREGVEGVHAHAALEAAAGVRSEQAAHL